MANLDATNRPPQEAPKHLVILQLTRAGDLVQTLQAVREVRNEKPQFKLTLVARKHYAAPLNFLLSTVFDEIVVIDTPQFFSGTLKESQTKIAELIGRICRTPVDAVVNLSYCKPSRYLTGLIPASHRLGPWMGADNQENITDRWSQLLYSTVTQGALNPFHLVDLFRLILGVKTKKATPTKSTSVPRKDWIVVHPFASAARKRWKPHKWSEVLYKLSKDHEKSTIFVVGAPNEVKEAEALFGGPLIKDRKNLVNLVGQTNLNDVFERLKVAKLFVGHDSLIGHLASMAQTKSLTVALGSVRPWETTPYGANNIVLAPRTKCFPCFPQEKCDLYMCHSDIPYQLVTDIAESMYRDVDLRKELKNKFNPFLTGSCQIHLTSFNPRSGLVDFEELDSKPGSLAQNMRMFYRMMWAFTLGEMDEHHGFPTLSREAHASLLNIMEGLGYLYELSEFGKKYSLAIVEEVAKPSPSLSKIKATTTKIDEIDRLASLVKRSHPTLAPVIDFYGLVRANLPGGNIVEIAQHSFFIYQDSALAASVLNELMEKTIAEYKISAQRAPTQSANR